MGSPSRSWLAALRFVGPLTVLVVLAVIWREASLQDQLGELLGVLAEYRDEPLLPLVVIAAFVVAGLLAVPLSLLVVTTIVCFGPLLGGAYAMTGAVLSGGVVFLIGRLIGQEALDRLLGDRGRRIARLVADRGVLSVAIIRNLPVAPYAVVNLVLGSSPVRLRDFLLGTFIGLMPAMLLLTLAGDRLRKLLTEPDLHNLWPLLAAVVLLVLTSVLIARLAQRSSGGSS
jgi:uncharacterized membrane protein YdjX (TVP38/TMEM64 family)